MASAVADATAPTANGSPPAVMPPFCQPLSNNKRETLWSATRLYELTESKEPLLQTVSIGLNETALRIEARELKCWLA